MYDFAGFIRPLQYGAPGGTDDFAIGGVDNILPGHVSLDVMAGLLSPGYIASRLLWVVIAVAVAALAGVVYQPHRTTGRIVVPGRVRRWLDGGAPPPAVVAAPPAAAAAIPAFGLLAAEFRLIGAGRLFKLLGAAVAIAALGQDFRHVASPAALLLLIFALTAHAGRSEARGLLLLTNTAPISPWWRRAAFVVAGMAWSLLLTAPALLTTPEWEINPAHLKIGPAIGEGEFGTVGFFFSPFLLGFFFCSISRSFALFPAISLFSSLSRNKREGTKTPGFFRSDFLSLSLSLSLFPTQKLKKKLKKKVHASTWHGAPVAVKVLKRSDGVALGDFRTELNVLQKVHHPGCVQFYGAITRLVEYEEI